ncbi:MAG: hypothetical protein ABI743_13690, partial [bacterium]
MTLSARPSTAWFRGLLPFAILASLMLPAGADSLEAPAEAPPSATPATTDFPDPLALLEAADGLFTSQGIDALSARMQVWRDSGNQITMDELGEDRVLLRGLIPLSGRYEYWSPNHYNFFMLGFLLASSEVNLNTQSLTSPLLPLPGGILTAGHILESFNVRVTAIEPWGDDPQELVDCYVVRLNPHDSKNAFFKSLTYYITVDEPHLVRGVRASFSDGASWTGTGWGTFTYKEDGDGHILPFLGTGTILVRNPDRKVVLKGKWSDFELNDAA